MTQTPAAMRDGLLPESDVIASESTIARTHNPASVNRNTIAPTTTIAMTQAYVMTLFRSTVVPSKWYTGIGSGESRGEEERTAWQYKITTIGATNTESPMVTTTLMSCDDSRRNRKMQR